MAGNTAGASAGAPGSTHLYLHPAARLPAPLPGGVCRAHMNIPFTQFWQ